MIWLSLALEIKYIVLNETSLTRLWEKLEKLYMLKSLTSEEEVIRVEDAKGYRCIKLHQQVQEMYYLTSECGGQDWWTSSDNYSVGFFAKTIRDFGDHVASYEVNSYSIWVSTALLETNKIKQLSSYS